MYYKRKDTRWCGPASVIGKDGKTVIIKHGGEIVRVHISQLIHVDRENSSQRQSINEINESNSNDETSLQDCTNMIESEEESELESSSDPNEPNETTEKNDEYAHGATIENADTQKDQQVAQIIKQESIDDAATEKGDNSDTTQQDDTEKHNESKVYPNVKTHIMYKTNDSADWKKGFVLSRAGKVGKSGKGKHKATYNIQEDKTDAINHYDFDKEVCEWSPVSSEVLLTNIDKEAKIVAKQIELQNWKTNNVYTEVDDKDQYAITSKWIMKTKDIDGNSTVKARLVARGFEDIHNQGKNDSPTCAKDTLRIALSIMASKQWKCMSMDIKTAFLQSFQLERDIFLVPPKEANTDKLWKLNKAVYGLNEASRQWYNRVSYELIKLGMERSKYDEALFYLKNNGMLIGIITVHVDDFLFGGTNEFHKVVIESIQAVFEIRTICETPLKYLGLSLRQTENAIVVDQNEYIDSLQEVSILDSKDNDRLLNKNEHRQYRRICGSLNWVSTQTRPDIAFDVAMISGNVNTPTVKHMKMANKVIRKVKSTSVEIVFCKLQSPLHLTVHCDASYANLPSGGSQGGHIVFLSDEEGYLSPLSWTSKRVRRVCRSTISAETMSMLDAVDASIWMAHLFEEINGYKLKHTKVKTDNESLNEAVHSTTAVKEKRLRVDIAAIRDEIRNRTIDVDWIPKAEQLADVLTKQGANRERLVNVLKNSHL